MEWHSLLDQGVQVARQLLRKLLPEPITLEPTPDGIHFRGRAAWGALLSASCKKWAWWCPRGDSNTRPTV